MAQKKQPTLTEQFKKAVRGLKRSVRALASGGNQLSYEKNGALLKGPDADIRKIRGLDLQLAAMVSRYNGVERVPDNVTAEIDRHVKDVSDSFRRVAAVMLVVTDSLDDLARGKLEKEVSLPALEYVNIYKSNAGNPVEQRLLKTYLG